MLSKPSVPEMPHHYLQVLDNALAAEVAACHLLTTRPKADNQSKLKGSKRNSLRQEGHFTDQLCIHRSLLFP